MTKHRSVRQVFKRQTMKRALFSWCKKKSIEKKQPFLRHSHTDFKKVEIQLVNILDAQYISRLKQQEVSTNYDTVIRTLQQKLLGMKKQNEDAIFGERDVSTSDVRSIYIIEYSTIPCPCIFATFTRLADHRTLYHASQHAKQHGRKNTVSTNYKYMLLQASKQINEFDKGIVNDYDFPPYLKYRVHNLPENYKSTIGGVLVIYDESADDLHKQFHRFKSDFYKFLDDDDVKFPISMFVSVGNSVKISLYDSKGEEKYCVCIHKDSEDDAKKLNIVYCNRLVDCILFTKSHKLPITNMWTTDDIVSLMLFLRTIDGIHDDQRFVTFNLDNRFCFRILLHLFPNNFSKDVIDRNALLADAMIYCDDTYYTTHNTDDEKDKEEQKPFDFQYELVQELRSTLKKQQEMLYDLHANLKRSRLPEIRKRVSDFFKIDAHDLKLRSSDEIQHGVNLMESDSTDMSVELTNRFCLRITCGDIIDVFSCNSRPFIFNDVEAVTKIRKGAKIAEFVLSILKYADPRYVDTRLYQLAHKQLFRIMRECVSHEIEW